MKKHILIFSLLLTSLYSSAQTIDFVKPDPQPDLLEIYGGSFANGDIDGDGDIDLLMSGITPARRTALYLNDGSGSFSKVEDTPFINTGSSVTIFEDLDDDGDLDLFFSGNGLNIQEYARVYLNDGLGKFTELANPLLPQFADSGVDIADVDGDGDKDLLIAVRDKNNEFMADIFLNDGSAVFTPSNSAVFTPVRLGTVDFSDLDNDGDMDVIIGGEEEDESVSVNLYLNDGSGNYSVDADANFAQLRIDDVDVADTDNDGDLDILMSGDGDNFMSRTILYINDGSGQFTELASTTLQNTSFGGNVFADLDNDGDQDIIIVGTQDGGLPNIYNIVYENRSNNEFIPVDTLGGEYIADIVVDDFNGDGLIDVIIQGFAEKTNVYWNASIVSSTQELLEASVLSMFPNPSSGELTLSLENDISEFDLSIYTSDGRLAYQQLSVLGRKTQLQLDLITGTYVVFLKTDNAVITKKLLIIK